MAVSAMVKTMSSTKAPRDKSLTGLRKPCNIGPTDTTLAERCTAFLALAGGIGTFEELFEAWTWKQLGYHDKPVAVLNTAGYYDHLLTFLQGSVAAGFMKPYQMDMIHIGTEVVPTLEYLVRN